MSDNSDTSDDSKHKTQYKLLSIDNENKYLYRVALVDLDPKSASNIPAYFTLDQNIVFGYKNQSSVKQCIL
jgi:hypothetical protein